MKLPVQLTLAAHDRGALPLVRAAWRVTERKASDNASNARGVAAGKMGRNSSRSNSQPGKHPVKIKLLRMCRP